MPRRTLTDSLLAEIILYGGFPVTRHTAYRLAMEHAEDRRAADLFAFGPQTQPTELPPMTIDDVRAEIEAAGK